MNIMRSVDKERFEALIAYTRNPLAVGILSKEVEWYASNNEALLATIITDLSLVPKLQFGNPVMEALASGLLSPLWNAIIRNRYHVPALPDRNGKSLAYVVFLASTSFCLSREAGASTSEFPSWSLGTSGTCFARVRKNRVGYAVHPIGKVRTAYPTTCFQIQPPRIIS
ncbi:MAG: hypothetical protein PHD39_10330 [Methylobacter tundripaludum]|nr:hypothetical protein [Methylobacter tundripaludum]